MSRRTQRIESLLRDVIGQIILAKISDPRIDPARVSVTHVEVPEDLLSAKVYVSVMGSEADQRKAVGALRHAAGRIQDLMMRQITLRNTPLLQFELDEKFKKSLETYQIIQKAMNELREKEEAKAAAEGVEPPAAEGDDEAASQSPPPAEQAPQDDAKEDNG